MQLCGTLAKQRVTTELWPCAPHLHSTHLYTVTSLCTAVTTLISANNMHPSVLLALLISGVFKALSDGIHFSYTSSCCVLWFSKTAIKCSQKSLCSHLKLAPKLMYLSCLCWRCLLTHSALSQLHWGSPANRYNYISCSVCIWNSSICVPTHSC